jgi:multidrug efflux pump subunit AcrA (membrane-fusion protein)
MIKYGLPILAVLSLLFAVSATIRMTPVQVRAEPLSAPPSTPFPHQIGAIGLVEAGNENVAIGAPVAGLTMAVYVKTGDRVAQGQPLFALDDRDLRAELSLRESNVALARARLEKLLAAPRQEELLPAQAEVSEAEASLNDVRTQLRLIEAVKDRRAVRQEDVSKRRSAVEM